MHTNTFLCKETMYMEQKMIYVGIDWADDHHDIFITDDSAKTLDQFRIDHTCDGFVLLHSHLANHQTSPGLVLIAIETSRGLLVHELLQKGYIVYAINPKAVNRYKDRHVLSKAKSDALDALSLGHILRTDRHLFQPLKPLPEDYRLLDRLCSDLRKVVDEKSRVTNQVISCLKEFYPKALDIFSLDSQIFIDFLRAFPDHRALSACTKKAFLLFLKKHRYPCPAKADELWKTIQAPTLQPDKVVARSGRLRLRMLLDQFENLKEHIAHYEQEIQAILDKLPESTSVKSLPGVGERLAPELIAILGPNSKDGHHRFQAAEEIAKLSGCVPVIRESGKWKTVSLRYACVKSLRRTFHDWAFASISRSSWARAFYDYHKERNQSHCTILRNLGKKWIKILFVVWSNGTSYDEALHIQNLKARNVPWAMAL
jgi:transposase